MSTKGQSLLELVVVIGVSVLVIGSLTFATISSIRNAQLAQNQAQATRFAQEGIERIRDTRDRNLPIRYFPTSARTIQWSGIWGYIIANSCPPSGLSGSALCYFVLNLSASNETLGLDTLGASTTFPQNAEVLLNGKFHRAVVISDISSSEKQISVIVSWSDFSGDHQSKLTTVLRKL